MGLPVNRASDFEERLSQLTFEKEARVTVESVHDFDATLRRHGCERLTRDSPPETLQVNLGKLCNQACHHCHVDAGPKRTEIMTQATARRVVELVGRSLGHKDRRHHGWCS